MRVLQIEVVAGPVQVGRHHEIASNPIPVRYAWHSFRPGNLGDGIPLVGRLQRPGQQAFLPDGLRSEPGIDAARSEKQELASTPTDGRLDACWIAGQVVPQEVRRIASRWPGCRPPVPRPEHHLRAFRSQRTVRTSDDAEIELGARLTHQQVHFSLPSRRDQAEPTRPRWPATQTLAPFSELTAILWRRPCRLVAILASRLHSRSASTICWTSSENVISASSPGFYAPCSGSPSNVLDFRWAEVARIHINERAPVFRRRRAPPPRRPRHAMSTIEHRPEGALRSPRAPSAASPVAIT